MIVFTRWVVGTVEKPDRLYLIFVFIGSSVCYCSYFPGRCIAGSFPGASHCLPLPPVGSR